MTPNSELRAKARAQLKGSIFSEVWLMALLVCLIAEIITSLASNLPLCGFIADGVLSFGLCHIYLSLVRGQKSKVDLEDLFSGSSQLGDLVVLGLLKNLFLTLWTFLFFVIGIVKHHSYAMTYYIKYDHPEYDWRMCIDESRRMMKGHKWRLFCLNLSFIGWYLLCLVTFGIAALWVIPYVQAATANFYEDLKTMPAQNAPADVTEAPALPTPEAVEGATEE